jgi:hypothetical protein
MAGESWKTVTFNEGAPLDANDLNQLQYNLTDVFIANTTLKNSLSVGSSSDATQQTLLMAAGTLGVIAVTKDVQKTVPLPIDSKFGSSIPRFIVSIGSDIANKVQVSVGVKSQDTTTPQAVISSNTTTNFVVNYIAFLIK